MSKRLPLEEAVKNAGNYYVAVHTCAKRARFLFEQDNYTFIADIHGELHKKTAYAIMELAEGKIKPKIR